jgi:hypothetical protein
LVRLDGIHACHGDLEVPSILTGGLILIRTRQG